MKPNMNYNKKQKNRKTLSVMKAQKKKNNKRYIFI